MDDELVEPTEELEAHSRFPTGIGRIQRGECPKGAVSLAACTFCMEGHILECHVGMTCEEAECSHYQQQLEQEHEDLWWGQD